MSTASADQPPIACTLDAATLPSRLADWQVVLDHAAARRAIDGGVRVQFGAELDVGDLARLAQAEQQCCAFFSFAVTIDQRGTGLEVTAPEDAAGIVAELFGLPTGS